MLYIAVRPTGEDRRGGAGEGILVAADAGDRRGSVAAGGALVELAAAADVAGDLGLGAAVLLVAPVLLAGGLPRRAVARLPARVAPHERTLGTLGLAGALLPNRLKLHREGSDLRHTGLTLVVRLRGVPTLVASTFYQVFLKTAMDHQWTGKRISHVLP